MAINIGANFSYQGERFLDNRQGIADNLNDLLEWDILVPEGFEVCVSGDWYIYDSLYNSPITGHFKKRPGFEDFKDLENKVFPLTFSTFSGGGTFEVGQQITPSLSWTLEKRGEVVVPNQVFVNGVEQTNKSSYTHPETIYRDAQFKVRCVLTDSDSSVESTAKYIFCFKKYWGVSSKTTLTNSDILSFSSDFASSWTMGATTFNCSGGKYPYYIIPSSLYDPSTFKMWIGGLRNTDIIVTTQEVVTELNRTQYTVIRLGTLQNGSPAISFSN